MNGLKPEDRAFLLKESKALRGKLIGGWVLLILPWVIGLLVALDPGSCIRLYERTSQAVCQPIDRAIDAQNAELQTLQTTTPLEADLVKRFMRQNDVMKMLLCRINVMVLLSAFGIVICGGLMHQGVSLLISASKQGRYLQIIRTLSSTDFR
jgi:hypothetical protein